jgi:hypothetical protein
LPLARWLKRNAFGVLNEGRGLRKIVDHNHQQNDQQVRKLHQDLMGFHTSLKQSYDRLVECASNVDKQMETITNSISTSTSIRKSKQGFVLRVDRNWICERLQRFLCQLLAL